MKLSRRDILFGAACVGALGGAEALRPRTQVRLMDATSLTDLIPNRIGSWSVGEGGDIVQPKVPGSLADRLYADTLTRRYVDGRNGNQIMLLIAYGGAQSDLLQLHRPESCYPAVGLEIQRRVDHDIALPGGGAIPAVALTAGAGGRIEDILYWTRLGEYLPRSAADQRRDRLKTAMAGLVSDGVLVRASTLRFGPEPADGVLDGFLKELVISVPAPHRQGLIGTDRALRLARG